MSGDRLYDDPALAEFYDLENHWGVDFDLIRAMARPGWRVLDLGCGTGQLGAGLAEAGCRVTGVDPAAAMLALAAMRPGGDRARWRQGDARDLRLDERFDLVVLTGHAFQVFLALEDRRAVLATIAAHLAPEGGFVFDSRNPLVEEWREWGPATSRRELHHPDYGPVEAWNDVERDALTGIVTYETVYALADGRRLAARSRIAFPPRAEIEALAREAGLAVADVWGDWARAPWTARSPEIVVTGGLAR